MALFINHYRCPNCGHEWDDEWDCTCDDDCPECGCRHISPYDSDDAEENEESDGLVLSAPTNGN